MSNVKIDAAGMVRRIRDEIYEETKGMSNEDLIAFFRRRSADTKEKLNQLQPKGDVPRRRA